MKLSVVIPVYNEIKTIKEILKKVESVPIKKEIIVPFPLHYLANAFLSWLTNAFFETRITDMETGYKMFTKEVYKKIKIESNRFDIEPEITAKIVKLGYKIYEVSIRTKPRNYQAGKKITAFDGLIAIWTLVKYRVLKYSIKI